MDALALKAYSMAKKLEATGGTGVEIPLDMRNAKNNGIKGDGITDDSAKIQAFLAASKTKGGELYFPEGTYVINSDVIFSRVNASLDIVPLKISAYGSKFVGTGRIVLDGVKRLTLAGFDAKTVNLVLRGFWSSALVDCNFAQLITGDVAGSSFSDIYWNNFQNIGLGQLVFDSARSHVNENIFTNLQFRDDNHGWTKKYDYNICINGGAANTALFRNNIFKNCDISYAKLGSLYIDPNHAGPASTITFENSYHDTNVTKLSPKIKVEVKGSYVAGEMILGASSTMAAAGPCSNYTANKSTEWINSSPSNLFADGTFLTGATAGATNLPADVTKQYFKTGGVSGGYVRITNTAAAQKIAYLNVANLPVAGNYSVSFWIRNGVAGNRTFRIYTGTQYLNVEANSTEWTYFTVSEAVPKAAGANQNTGIYCTDNLPYTVDICCFSVTLGRTTMLTPPQDAKAYIDAIVAKNSLQAL